MRLNRLVGLGALALLSSNVNAGVIFQDGFESGDKSHSENGASWGSLSSKNAIVSSGKPFTGRYSLALTCPPKPNTGGAGEDCTNEQRFELGPRGFSDLWISYKLFIPSKYFHRHPASGSNNNKFLALWAETYSESGSWMSNETWRTGDGDSKLSWNPPGSAGGQNHNFTDSVFIDRAKDAGKWHQIIYHVKIASGPGKNDGVLELWKGPAGGALIKYFDVKNVSNWGPDWGGAPTENYFRHGYLFGWSNSGFDEETTYYIDDIVFSTSPLLGTAPKALQGVAVD